MENYYSEIEKNTTDEKSEIYWLYIFVFIICSMAIGGVAYLLCGNNLFTFQVNNEPIFAIESTFLKWIIMFGLDLLGISSYFMWLSKYTENRPKKEILENFIPLIIQLFLFLMWTLFTFGLNLPIVGCAMLGGTAVVAIYTTYRYFNSSIISGILSTLWTLLLIYVLSTHFAYCLIK